MTFQCLLSPEPCKFGRFLQLGGTPSRAAPRNIALIQEQADFLEDRALLWNPCHPNMPHRRLGGAGKISLLNPNLGSVTFGFQVCAHAQKRGAGGQLGSQQGSNRPQPSLP